MGKTKAEEFEALRKIREILEGFDPEDTYIGKAFEDCVEQAETNLRNDWMQSWKDRYDRVLEQFRAANARIMDVTRQLNQKDDTIARLEDAKNQLEQEASRADAELAAAKTRAEDAEAKNHWIEYRILELKAKLYDMMTGEEVKG